MPLNDVLRRGLQPISSALTSNRILWYSLLSTLATTAAIANACRNYSTFYSVAVYLSRSGRSLLVLANFGFIIALMSGRILQRVFFGSLQPREVERLYDQTWMFVTESLLAFTIFRDDFDIPFVIMFGFLLFIKCFHWLMADRVESMDQVPYPGPPTLFHVRLHALFCILWLVDMIMLVIAIESTLSTGVGGAVLFANEYAILTAHALNSMARYVLSAYELRRARARGGENAPSWENKSMYVFYIELVTDFLKLATYSTFFLVVLSFYGLPLNIIRDVYLTARSFITRLRALVRYHNATRDMDRRYPNATEEELAAMSDRTCIICRDELIAAPNNQTNIQQEGQAPNNVPNANQPQDGPNVTPKKLPCGHIFHFQCLRSWLERQQSCPTCRRTVLETGQPTRNAAQQRGARQPGQQHNNAVPQAPPVPGQQQPPPNNGLGWLGRLLGVALQPPLVPGQFANGPVPAQFIPAGPPGQQQLPANVAWAAPGQQLPPGYAYIPYYPIQPQVPPQQLRPPPAMRGWYGPGGVFYAWDPEARDLPQGQEAPAQQAQAGMHPQQPFQAEHTPSQSSTSAPIADPSASASTGASNTPKTALTSKIQPTDAESDVSTDEPSAPSPREAAALAALRRVISSHPSSTSRSTPPQPAESTRAAASTEASGNSSDATVRSTAAQQTPLPSASTSISVPQPTPTPTTTTASSAGSTQKIQPRAPALIPLMEPVHYTLQASREPVSNGRLPEWVTRTAPRPPRAFNFAPPRGDFERMAANHRLNPLDPSAHQLPATLPATLTEEQLKRMDSLTRDAIDERLQVLDRVSNTLFRCINDLQRMRSALPLREGLAQGTSAATGGENAEALPESPSAAASSSNPPASTDKGKAVSTDNLD